MNMFEKEDILTQVLQTIKNEDVFYKQYLHKGVCKSGPCGDKGGTSNDMCCSPFIWCIHASNQLHKLPKHPHCDCFYQEIKTIPIGLISNRHPSPDLWLQMFGKLPDYYITKKEAESLGWKKGKNTISGKAPGKMIGGDVYENKRHILPEKEGRTWRECDINYENGRRKSLRLYYSNDGLFFYSSDHGETQFYLVK